MDTKFYTTSKNPSYRWGLMVEPEGRYVAKALWEFVGGRAPSVALITTYRPAEERDFKYLESAGADKALLAKVSGYIARLKKAVSNAPTPEARLALRDQETMLADQFGLLSEMYSMAGRVRFALESGPLEAVHTRCRRFGRCGNLDLFVHGNVYKGVLRFGYKRRMI